MMATCSTDKNFSAGLLYALKKLGRPNISLKKEQIMSVEAIYNGKDVFVWLPTGFGKSLCFQVLPFMMDHKLGLIGTKKSCSVLIICPLLALMMDQVQSLRRKGVKSSVITSGNSFLKEVYAADECSLLQDSLLFCTPEALIRSKWRFCFENPAVSKRIVAVVVDEAHCVSKW